MEEMGVVEPPCLGKKVPQYQPNGPAASRIERFMLFQDLLELWNVRDFTSSFVALIGKTKNPHELSSFSPISLIGCIYKIIAKLLSNRFKGALPKCISPSQTAFIQKKQIVDGVLVVNEIINLAKRKKFPFYMFKFDFDKACNMVSWNFLDYMLGRMGFNDKWRAWMKPCIFSESVSILVSGSPTKEFSMARGLRKGDPMASFLFLIVAEGLAGLIKTSIEAVFFGVFPLKADLSFPILQFADDTGVRWRTCGS